MSVKDIFAKGIAMVNANNATEKAAELLTRRGCGCRTGRILVRSSHFMRNLFSSGLGFLELLATEPGFGDSNGERYVHHIHENVKALYSLIEELTDMARVEEGTEMMLVEEVDACAFFSLIRERMHRLGVSLEVECQEAVSLRLDRKRLAKTMAHLMLSVAQEGIRQFTISVTEADGRMADLLLSGIADSDLRESTASAPAGATLEPTLNLELFKGWVDVMDGFVHETTVSSRVFKVRFSLPV